MAGPYEKIYITPSDPDIIHPDHLPDFALFNS
jgi:hypothetical protein